MNESDLKTLKITLKRYLYQKVKVDYYQGLEIINVEGSLSWYNDNKQSIAYSNKTIFYILMS